VHVKSRADNRAIACIPILIEIGIEIGLAGAGSGHDFDLDFDFDPEPDSPRIAAGRRHYPSPCPVPAENFSIEPFRLSAGKPFSDDS
jgi:hypothetical protein